MIQPQPRVTHWMDPLCQDSAREQKAADGNLTSARLALLLGDWLNFPALAQSKSPLPPRRRVTQASLEQWLWPLGPTLVHTP